MEIRIEVAEARDGFGLLLAAEVSDIRGNVSFAVADKLKLGELYRKLTTAVNEHLAENIAKVEHARAALAEAAGEEVGDEQAS